jgi:hypothetical protein
MNSYDKIHAALVSQIVALQARVDGLQALVEILALNAGSDRQKVKATLKTVTESSHQVRLDRIEDLSPTAAALIDQREDIDELDLDLIDELGFEEK